MQNYIFFINDFLLNTFLIGFFKTNKKNHDCRLEKEQYFSPQEITNTRVRKFGFYALY